MNRQSEFERILASLHDAVLDDTLWPATSGLIDEACGAKGNFLVAGDGASHDDVDIFFARFCFRGKRREDFERQYFATYHACDERIPRLRVLPDRHLVHVSSLYTEEEKRTSFVYNEVLGVAHTRDSLNVRLNGPEGSRIVWVVADPVDARGWSSKRVKTIERLLPHIRQYVWVRQALVDARALGSSLTALLENAQCGIIHLDRHGRIMAVNDQARNLLARGDGIVDEDGFLHAAARRDGAALQHLLARAMPSVGGEAAGGSITVRRGLDSPPLVVHVSPVSPARADADGSRIGAVVLLIDPARRPLAAPEVVAEALGLTPAESGIAVSLAGGMTVRDIALATGRSEGTVRWHVQHILRKHDFSRQYELVQLVRSLGEVP